jgi:glutathione S-transferase
MLTLCGFALSNYHNKVKLALLEKGIPFQEESVRPSQDEALLKRSPLGKIPFIETEQGCLSESQAILEFLEETYPEKPLYPADAFARAKTRELGLHIELNVELHARRLYGEAFFGGTASEETKAEVKTRVEKGLEGLNRLAKFSPYIEGGEFTAADCLAWVHFRLVSTATEIVYGENLVAKHIPGLAGYLQLLESRPAVQQVAADRDQAWQLMAAPKQ